MFLLALSVEGLWPSYRLEIDHLPLLAPVPGDPRELSALLDALDLFFAAFDPERLRRLLLRLGLAEPGEELEVTGEPFPEQASWPRPDGARALLHPEGSRAVRVSALFELDAPQFRRLREAAARDPRLLDGLSSRLELRVGYLWNRDLTALSVGLLRLRFEDAEPLPLAGGPPDWAVELLRDFPRRYLRLEGDWAEPAGLARHWAEALLSPLPERQAARLALESALAAAPLSLPGVRPARWGRGLRLVAGERSVPLERYGPRAVELVSLAAAAQLSGADILALPWPSPGLLGDELAYWLEQRVTEGPLEQLLLFGLDGEEAVEPRRAEPPPEPPGLPFRRATGGEPAP